MSEADCPDYPESPGEGRLTRDEFERWVDAYIEFQKGDNHPDNDPLWWAVLWFMDLGDAGGASPEDCWRAILAILTKEPDDRVLGILAAGPLEDLIETSGSQFIERIEQQARAHSSFRDLLRGVWESGSEDVWRRVQRAQDGPTGFED